MAVSLSMNVNDLSYALNLNQITNWENNSKIDIAFCAKLKESMT